MVFHALDAGHIESIARIQLEILQARLAKMDLALQVSPAALAELAKVGSTRCLARGPQARDSAAHREPAVQAAAGGRFPPKSEIAVGVDPVLEPGVFPLQRRTAGVMML